MIVYTRTEYWFSFNIRWPAIWLQAKIQLCTCSAFMKSWRQVAEYFLSYGSSVDMGNFLLPFSKCNNTGCYFSYVFYHVYNASMFVFYTLYWCIVRSGWNKAYLQCVLLIHMTHICQFHMESYVAFTWLQHCYVYQYCMLTFMAHQYGLHRICIWKVLHTTWFQYYSHIALHSEHIKVLMAAIFQTYMADSY